MPIATPFPSSRYYGGMSRTATLAVCALLATSAGAQGPLATVTATVPGAHADGTDRVRTTSVALGRTVGFDPGLEPWRCEATFSEESLASQTTPPNSAGRPYYGVGVTCWASQEQRAAGVVAGVSMLCHGVEDQFILRSAGNVAYVLIRCP